MITQNDVERLFSSDVYETDGTKIGSTGHISTVRAVTPRGSR